jgi:hypothetical protein
MQIANYFELAPILGAINKNGYHVGSHFLSKTIPFIAGR